MSNADVKARLKSLRKKYHLGEFRKTKHRTHKNKRSERVKMRSRKRKAFRYSYRPHRRSSGGFGLGGLNLFELGMMGMGAGFAGFVGSQTSNLTGGKLTGNAAQAVSGVAIYFVGKKLAGGKYTTPIAKGILIKTIGDLVEDNVVPMVSGNLTNSSSNTNAGF